jgi:hypothetical protein
VLGYAVRAKQKPKTKKSKPRPKPTPAPQIRRPDFGSAGVRRSPKPRTSTKQEVKQSRAQAKTYGSPKVSDRMARDNKRTAVKNKARRERLLMQARRRRFFPKDAVKGAQRSQAEAIRALADLKAQDPEKYERKGRSWLSNAASDVGDYLEESVRSSRGPGGSNTDFSRRLTSDAASGADRVLKSAAAGASRQINKTSRARSKMGLDVPGADKLVKEGIDIVANAPSGAYLTADAVASAAKGDTRKGKKLIKEFEKSSALVPLAKGDLGEARKRANERPLTTFLELSGTKALIGRGAGAAMRHSPSSRLRQAASTQRAPQRLYLDSETKQRTVKGNVPVGGKRGPAVKREYSRDVINKGIQVAGEKIAARRGRDPNVDHGSKVAPGRPRWRRQVDREVDRQVFASARAMEMRRQQAAKHANRAKGPERERLLLAARADKIRAELREAARLATGPRRRAFLALTKLSDRKLIARVEHGAAPRVKKGTTRSMPYSKAEQASAVKAINRRVRRGKPVSLALQKAADDAARRGAARTPGSAFAEGLSRAITGDIPSRRAGERLFHAARRNPLGKTDNAPMHLGTEGAARNRFEYLNSKGDDPILHTIELPPNVRLVDLRERIGEKGDGPSQTDRMANDLEAVIRFRKNDPDFDPFDPRQEGTAGLRDASKLLDELQAKGVHGVRYRNNVEGGDSVLLFDRSSLRRKPGPRGPRPEDFSSFFEGARHPRAIPPKRVAAPDAWQHMANIKAADSDIMPTAVARAVDEAGKQNLGLIADEFGIPVGKRGYVSSSKAAERAAYHANRQDPSVDLVPFRVANKRYVLVPRQVAERFEKHANVDRHSPTGTVFDTGTRLFKDVVLTTSSPSKWIGGNVTDIGLRSLNEGLTPLDPVRGFKVGNRMKQQGLQGEQAWSNLTGGGLMGIADDLSQLAPAARWNLIGRGWRGWKRTIYTLEHAIEKTAQAGMVGKQFRRENQRQANSIKGLLKMQDEALDRFAKGLSTDRAFEAKVAREVENLIGRWGKVSPGMRRALALAPFAQWLGASTRYVYVTLPVHHPIKTGILAGIMQMTEPERRALGLSYFAEPADRAPDYQMGLLPQHVMKSRSEVKAYAREEGLSADETERLLAAVKHGPVVKGTRTSRMTSFGTAANPGDWPGFALPQFSGAFDAMTGTSFTGEPLEYPPDYPEKYRDIGLDLMDRIPVAAGAQLETAIPFASAFRRAFLEGGQPSEPYSTILTPSVRRKLNYDTGEWETPQGSWQHGLKKWMNPVTPEGRVYSLGAQRDIDATQKAMRKIQQWNKERITTPGMVDPYDADAAPARKAEGQFTDPYGEKPKKRRGKKTETFIDPYD